MLVWATIVVCAPVLLCRHKSILGNKQLTRKRTMPINRLEFIHIKIHCMTQCKNPACSYFMSYFYICIRLIVLMLIVEA